MSFNPQSQEIKLFEFHLDPNAYYPNMNMPNTESMAVQHESQHSFSYISDALTNTSHYADDRGYMSPQLTSCKPPNFNRKRCKTVNDSNNYPNIQAFSLNAKKEESMGMRAESPIKNEDGLDEDDDEDEELGSDEDDQSPSKRRGKYKVYTDDEKANIIAHMKIHGIQSTLEKFSDTNNKITKRKLKSWLDSQHKVKGVKGRKTNDPNRDQALHEWCTLFSKDNGRSPTRKEATKKALELSGDPSFQASKGWLDKFSRKYMVEFTPLKIVPGKTKKTFDGESNSMVDNSDASSVEAISPLMRAIKANQPAQQGNDHFIKGLDSGASYNNYEYAQQKLNSYMDFTSKGLEAMHLDGSNGITPLDLIQNNYQQQNQQPYYNNNLSFDGVGQNFHLNYPMGGFNQSEDNYKWGYQQNQNYGEIGNYFNSSNKYENDTYPNNDFLRFDNHF